MQTVRWIKNFINWGWNWVTMHSWISDEGSQTPRKGLLVSKVLPDFFPGAPDLRVLSGLTRFLGRQRQWVSWSCLGQNDRQNTIIALNVCNFQVGRNKEVQRNLNSNYKATSLVNILNLRKNSRNMLAGRMSQFFSKVNFRSCFSVTFKGVIWDRDVDKLLTTTIRFWLEFCLVLHSCSHYFLFYFKTHWKSCSHPPSPGSLFWKFASRASFSWVTSIYSGVSAVLIHPLCPAQVWVKCHSVCRLLIWSSSNLSFIKDGARLPHLLP